MEFYVNTDTVDIDSKSVGVHGPSYDARGLCVQIRHNRDKALFETACQMQRIIAEALNKAVEDGRLVLPPYKDIEQC